MSLSRKPLIDGDILLHEIGWSGQFKDKETGEEILLPFHTVHEILDEKINLICREVGATEAPTLYFSDSEWLAKKEGRDYVPNFRYKVATTKPYKGTRVSNLPFHYYNILVTCLATYDCHVSHRGLEADDEMGIAQNENTIICSRDKDLRQVPGWHYSWVCGTQEALGPHYTDPLGEMVVKTYRTASGAKKKKTYGYGWKFLFYQLLVGDAVDNIPGLKGWGEVAAYKLVNPLTNLFDVFRAVRREYDKQRPNDSADYFYEQGTLLFIRQKDDEGFGQFIDRSLRWDSDD